MRHLCCLCFLLLNLSQDATPVKRLFYARLKLL
jgi:hypothetical protein